eukprot:gnl/TRDRNA2_/TRDRNA2_167252_c0_seq2.p1 gnl/TRDRNA2_/TRDRNA2_167252_c0~~gnl/TRDRNA2_/TRDRNA2_167252_c0_seq2.p1  ORF type:complete len:414 (+),score=61.54 gnl/TRDRNA2_/TRDRNA2_167252_c0_seq2:81-1322(+)
MQERTHAMIVAILLAVIGQSDTRKLTLRKDGMQDFPGKAENVVLDKLFGRLLQARPQSRKGMEQTALGKATGRLALPNTQLSALRPRANAGVSSGPHLLRASTSRLNRFQEHVPVDLTSFRVEELSKSPRILLFPEFVTNLSICDAIASEAEAQGYTGKGVDYAVWRDDVAEDLRTWMRGPALWATLGTELAANNGVIFADWAADDGAVPRTALAALAAITYAGATLLGAAVSAAKAIVVRQSLVAERTSQSVNLDPALCKGAEEFVKVSERLFGCHRRYFERPTAVKYRPGERLAPHFDANQPYFAPGYDAKVNEDMERGGQTLATLLLYCTDVEAEETGGMTRFGRLGIDVKPKKGDALLFFPALADGKFDERTEHEGVPPQISGKVVARIWRHMYDVPAPMGLAAPTDNS